MLLVLAAWLAVPVAAWLGLRRTRRTGRVVLALLSAGASAALVLLSTGWDVRGEGQVLVLWPLVGAAVVAGGVLLEGTAGTRARLRRAQAARAVLTAQAVMSVVLAVLYAAFLVGFDDLREAPAPADLDATSVPPGLSVTFLEEGCGNSGCARRGRVTNDLGLSGSEALALLETSGWLGCVPWGRLLDSRDLCVEGSVLPARPDDVQVFWTVPP